MFPGRSSERDSCTVAVPRSQVFFHPAASPEAEEALIGYRSHSLSAEDGFLTDLTHAVTKSLPSLFAGPATRLARGVNRAK